MVLLLLTLGLTGLLAYEAWGAARSHRATAANALEDFATVAAREYATALERHVQGLYIRSLRPFARSPGGEGATDSLPAPSRLEETACGECPLLVPSRYFRLDLERGSLAIRGEDLGEEGRLRLADTLADHVRAVHRREWAYGTLIRDADGGELVVYRIVPEPDGGPAAALGMTAELERLRPAFRRVAEEQALLPSSLTEGVPEDSLLAVRVETGNRTLYESKVTYPPTYAGTMALDPRLGGLEAEVRLRPDAAERLVIGGLPRSRLPLLLGVTALAFGLLLVAVFQLRRQRELARLRSDFVASTSHELRTPLAQIRMFAETLLLDRVRSDDERRQALEIIAKEARRLGHLVGNVLQFSRLERRESGVDLERCRVGDLVEDVLTGFEPIAREGGCRVRTEVDEGAIVSADPDALRRILLNLLDNAVKYGPAEQRVTVGATVADGRLRLLVDDEGPGVPPDQRERVWESFSRLDRDAGSEVAGSGIGLAVVRRLAEEHGGEARVEDAPSGGARFVVELPDAWRRRGA